MLVCAQLSAFNKKQFKQRIIGLNGKSLKFTKMEMIHTRVNLFTFVEFFYIFGDILFNFLNLYSRNSINKSI